MPNDYSELVLTILIFSNLNESKKRSIIKNFEELLTDFGRYRVRRYLSLEGFEYFLERLKQEIQNDVG